MEYTTKPITAPALWNYHPYSDSEIQRHNNKPYSTDAPWFMYGLSSAIPCILKFHIGIQCTTHYAHMYNTLDV